MRKLLLSFAGLFLLPIANANAGDLGVNVILSGELRPGLYGQVELGNAPRPAMVYDYPVMVREERVYRYAEPVYLHVPPAYISNWSYHCGYYHACGRRVYFVRSVEYDNYYRNPHHHYYDMPRRYRVVEDRRYEGRRYEERGREEHDREERRDHYEDRRDHHHHDHDRHRD